MKLIPSRRVFSVCAATVAFVAVPVSAAEEAWPANEWSRVTAAEAGLDLAELEAARDYAVAAQGAGYITRHGRLVLAWGDPRQLYDLKSSSKSFGSIPLQKSPLIQSVRWAPKETIVRRALGSDNWPLTWANDDAIYGAFGDGNGFEPFTREKLSLGLARIVGGPTDFRGENLSAPSLEARGGGSRGRKASGLLCVGGMLCLWARNTGNAQLAWSTDHGRSWTWASWKFTRSFGCPTFSNCGPDNRGSPDGFAYVCSPDSDDAYSVADRFVLTRVPVTRIRERSAYEFFSGRRADGSPAWASDVEARAPILSRAGACYRPSLTFNAGLGRYLLVHPRPNERSRDAAGTLDLRFQGGLAIYEAPQPWGPWSVVFDTDAWDVGPGDSASFPAKWISADGCELFLVFSGNDSFSVRKATFLRAGP